MKILISGRESIAKILRILTAASILTAAGIVIGYLSPRAISQETNPRPSNEKLSPEELRLREEWRTSMAQVPMPKKGCFQSSYPSKEWREVPCVPAPNYPMPPQAGAGTLVSRNNTDVAAQSSVGRLPARAMFQATTPPPANENLSPEELRVREDWRISMAQVPLPKKGCFQSSYPSRQWREVRCVPAPKYPMPPRRGPRPLVVGNADDIAAQSPTATSFISMGIGSFQSVTGVTSESGPIGNAGPSIANAYSLQLNTDFFKSSACNDSPNVNCRGWEQFLYANSGSAGLTYIQYWLIKYNKACPAGQSWTQFSFTGSTDIYCYKNDSLGAMPVPNQPITNLGHMSLTGDANAPGDKVTVGTGGSIVYGVAGDNAVNAAGGWTTAEFNVFGDGGNNAGGGQASFNSGSNVVPRTRIIYGGTAPPNCTAQGFTAETNNLSFGPTAPTTSAPGPALLFAESSAGGATSNCAAATGVGDTHLRTFGGLFYDFQASGDFVLAQADPDFVVETRQVSGAPTWPNATVNHAVATRMGKTQVAVCLAPARINVGGKNIDLGDQPFSTPDGVDIWRQGNVYTITDAEGDSVRAEVNPTWINVTVGLGHWPAKVSGLLANANGNVNQIAMRDGAVLTNPFSFEDLYARYGESWRVASDDTLLSVCGQRNVESGNPRTTFYAKDLDRTVYERTRAVCTAAGVKGEALLDACTLDVAVIGNDAAAQVFVGAPEPTAVGIVTNPADHGLGHLKWLLWLILIVILLWILRLLLKRKTP